MSNQLEDAFTAIASKVNAVILEKEKRDNNKTNDSAAATSGGSKSAQRLLDLWQPRDWPHRRGDKICLNLHSIPLDDTSPGRRPHPCEICNGHCKNIQENVLCWKCKGAYCIKCFVAEPGIMMLYTKMDTILSNTGFGKCPVCMEPLRSIALIDGTRRLIEPMSRTKLKNHGFGMQTVQGDEAISSLLEVFGGMKSKKLSNEEDEDSNKQGQSLVQEAEDALARAQSFRREKQNKTKYKQAIIDEYTHAINAINYFASISKGAGLVLRPHDLLLIAHYERAIVEGNKEIANAILSCYPKASVRSQEQDEEHFRISRSGFCSLFYPLPGCLLVGSPHQPSPSSSGLFCFDLRTESKERAFESSNTKEQIRLVGGISNQQQFMKEHPDCDDMDNNYSNLHGFWKGVLSYTLNTTPSSMSSNMNLAPLLTLEEQEIHVAQFVQFIRVFPTATAAAEYTRIMFETKTIVEEVPPVSAQNCRRLAKIIKKKAKDLLAASSSSTVPEAATACPSDTAETMDLRQVHVLQGEEGKTSLVAAVGNVSTKILVTCTSNGGDQPLCVLLARALVYLHKHLESCRIATPSRSSVGAAEPPGGFDAEQIIHCADFTLCAYCGKSDSSGKLKGKLKGCTRCMAARYCNADCQRNHWVTKGPNSHKTLCKAVKKQQKN